MSTLIAAEASAKKRFKKLSEKVEIQRKNMNRLMVGEVSIDYKKRVLEIFK
jgi:DNA-binding Xre family transcriptional regulator